MNSDSARTDVSRSDIFRYVGYDLDPARNLLVCRYRLDDRDFREEITFPGGGDWDSPAVTEAARLVFPLRSSRSESGLSCKTLFSCWARSP